MKSTTTDLSLIDTAILFPKIRNLSFLSLMDKEIMVIIFLTGIQSSDNAILAEYFSGVESIIMSSSLSVAEKKVWLSGLSIGRASTNYWIDYDLGNR